MWHSFNINSRGFVNSSADLKVCPCILLFETEISYKLSHTFGKILSKRKCPSPFPFLYQKTSQVFICIQRFILPPTSSGQLNLTPSGWYVQSWLAGSYASKYIAVASTEIRFKCAMYFEFTFLLFTLQLQRQMYAKGDSNPTSGTASVV